MNPLRLEVNIGQNSNIHFKAVNGFQENWRQLMLKSCHYQSWSDYETHCSFNKWG